MSQPTGGPQGGQQVLSILKPQEAMALNGLPREAMAGVLHIAAAIEKIGDAASDIARVVQARLGIPDELRPDLRHADEMTGRVKVREGAVAVGQSLRIAIARRMDLQDVAGEPFGAARDDGDLIAARRDHHLIGDMEFVNMLPKTRSGKIMRRVLKAVTLGKDPGDITTIEDESSVEEARRAWEQLKAEVQS